MRGCVFLLTWYFWTNWCTSIRSSAASAPYVGEPELRFIRLPVFPEATSALALASPSPPSLSTTVLSEMLPTTTLLPSLPSPSSGGGDGESRGTWLTFPAANAFPVLSSTSMSRSSALMGRLMSCEGCGIGTYLRMIRMISTGSDYGSAATASAPPQRQSSYVPVRVSALHCVSSCSQRQKSSRLRGDFGGDGRHKCSEWRGRPPRAGHCVHASVCPRCQRWDRGVSPQSNCM